MFRNAARISSLARMVNSRKLFVTPVSNLVRESDIRQTLQKEFPGADVVVTDTSDGCGANFSIEVGKYYKNFFINQFGHWAPIFKILKTISYNGVF